MNWFDRWMQRRLVRKMISQGPRWQGNVQDLFEDVNRRYVEVFHEDNYFDRRENLLEILEKSTKIFMAR
jgi:hypothetical protein